MGCSVILKNALGMVGVIIIIGICIIPITKLVTLMTMYYLGSALCQPIADGKISEVKVTNDSETPGIGGILVNSKGELKTNGGESPVTRIPAAIVAGQTLKVDTVTGATITSAAVISAVTSALEQAGADVNALKEIKNFFENYKKLQHVKVEIGKYYSKEEALEVLEKCRSNYKDQK